MFRKYIDFSVTFDTSGKSKISWQFLRSAFPSFLNRCFNLAILHSDRVVLIPSKVLSVFFLFLASLQLFFFKVRVLFFSALLLFITFIIFCQRIPTTLISFQTRMGKLFCSELAIKILYFVIDVLNASLQQALVYILNVLICFQLNLLLLHNSY